MLRFDSPASPELIAMLKAGAVGVLPTDTVYGLACLATDKTAVARLYELKAREHKPGTIIAADIQQLVDLGLKRRYLKAVTHLWPNSLSIIIPCGSELNYLHKSKNGLAVRLIADSSIQALLSQTGPLLTTSANHPDQPIAATVKLAQQYFNGQVDFYVNGGDLTGRLPSTLIRVVDDAIEVLRPGAVTINPETGEIVK
jgi:L-threonylcarbamoyladenylate synthase